MPAKKGHKVPNNFSDNPERAREAGKKGKRRPLNEAWADKLHSSIKEGSDNTYLDALYNILLRESNQGNMAAIRELLDRTFGRSKQTIEHEGKIESTINPSAQALIDLRKELSDVVKKTN